MHRSEVQLLDPTRQYWVPAVVAPHRDWEGARGCTKGARFMVEGRTLGASREEFEMFESELHCLSWIMKNRAQLNRSLPHARIRAVALDRWLLGLE